MKNQLSDICFLCGHQGVCNLLMTKRPPTNSKDGGGGKDHHRNGPPHFACVRQQVPAPGAKPVDANGNVRACGLCSRLLVEQWNVFEKQNIPFGMRQYWLKTFMLGNGSGGGRRHRGGGNNNSRGGADDDVDEYDDDDTNDDVGDGDDENSCGGGGGDDVINAGRERTSLNDESSSSTAMMTSSSSSSFCALCRRSAATISAAMEEIGGIGDDVSNSDQQQLLLSLLVPPLNRELIACYQCVSTNHNVQALLKMFGPQIFGQRFTKSYLKVCQHQEKGGGGAVGKTPSAKKQLVSITATHLSKQDKEKSSSTPTPPPPPNKISKSVEEQQQKRGLSLTSCYLCACKLTPSNEKQTKFCIRDRKRHQLRFLKTRPPLNEHEGIDDDNVVAVCVDCHTKLQNKSSSKKPRGGSCTKSADVMPMSRDLQPLIRLSRRDGMSRVEVVVGKMPKTTTFDVNNLICRERGDLKRKIKCLTTSSCSTSGDESSSVKQSFLQQVGLLPKLNIGSLLYERSIDRQLDLMMTSFGDDVLAAADWLLMPSVDQSAVKEMIDNLLLATVTTATSFERKEFTSSSCVTIANME